MAVSLDAALPFDGTPAFEAQWQAMFGTWLADGIAAGVGNELQPFADSTGRQVKVNDGRVRIAGTYGDNASQKTLAVTTNGSGNPRIDRIVVRINYSSNLIELDVKAGTPSASPSPPALTDNSLIRERSLAQVGPLANGYSTIAAGLITDERSWLSARALPSYVDVAARDLWVGLPSKGQVAFTRVNGQIWVFDSDATWRRTRYDSDSLEYAVTGSNQASASSLTTWPNGLTKSVLVPPWANRARLFAKIGQASALITGTCNTNVDVRLGSVVGQVQKIHDWPNAARPVDIVLQGTIDPSAMLGQTVTLRTAAQDVSSDGSLFVDTNSKSSISVEFY